MVNVYLKLLTNRLAGARAFGDLGYLPQPGPNRVFRNLLVNESDYLPR